jgi:hypothetical protein
MYLIKDPTAKFEDFKRVGCGDIEIQSMNGDNVE